MVEKQESVIKIPPAVLKKYYRARSLRKEARAMLRVAIDMEEEALMEMRSLAPTDLKERATGCVINTLEGTIEFRETSEHNIISDVLHKIERA